MPFLFNNKGRVVHTLGVSALNVKKYDDVPNCTLTWSALSPAQVTLTLDGSIHWEFDFALLHPAYKVNEDEYANDVSFLYDDDGDIYMYLTGRIRGEDPSEMQVGMFMIDKDDTAAFLQEIHTRSLVKSGALLPPSRRPVHEGGNGWFEEQLEMILSGN